VKIIIISLPRSGSTSLLHKLSNDMKLEEYNEPFRAENNHKDYNWLDGKDNYIVKTLIGQPRVKNAVSFYKEYCKKFDKIILLSRRDLLDCAKSYAYLQWNLSTISKNDNYVWEITPNLNEVYQTILNLNSNLEKLSSEINIDIIYYEDIYDKNSNDRLRKKSVKRDVI